MERELSTVLRMNKCFITNVESIFKIIFDHMVECLSLPFPQKPARLLIGVYGHLSSKHIFPTGIFKGLWQELFLLHGFMHLNIPSGETPRNFG